jgi:hypothetical protein
MKTPTLLAAAGTVLAVTAATVVLASPGQADASTSSAFGISAEGPLPLEPTPSISSSDGRLRRSSAGSVPDNPVVSATIAALYAGNRKAGITVANAAVGQGLFDALPDPPQQLQDLQDACREGASQVPQAELPELAVPGLPAVKTPRQLSALCDSLQKPAGVLGVDLLEVRCQGAAGEVKVAGVRLLGQRIDIPSTAPNTKIPADPLLDITINKQTRNADGSFTVSGLVVDLGGTEVLTLGSATCGRAVAGRAPVPADAPTPVVRDLPVTG